MVRLKVAGISSLTDARYCAGMGVEYLSFTFDKDGKSSLSSDNLQAIKPWVEGVKWIGEFSGNDPERLKKAASDFETNSWLLPADFSSGMEGIEIWRVFTPEKVSDPFPEGNLQLQLEGFSEREQIQILQHASQRKGQLMIGNFYPPEEALALSSRFPDLIFCLQSASEERPGWMDLSGLQDYLDALDQF